MATEIVFKKVPKWVAIEDSKEVYYPEVAIPRRFDGQVGKYFLGSEEDGDRLWVNPIDWRWDKSTRWGRVEQLWLDLAFVDRRGIVGQVSFKKDSGVNVADAIAQIKAQGVDLPCVWLELQTESREVVVMGETGESVDVYYVATVGNYGFVDESRYLAAKSFADSGAFQWSLVGEVA